jgi:lysophospholipase L1-like esterase
MVTATSSTGIAVTYSVPVALGGVAPVQVACLPAPASVFAVGSTTVRCTATDARQTSTSCSFSVTVNPPVPQIARTRFLAFGDSMTAGEITASVGATSEGSRNLRLAIVPSAAYPTQLLTQLRARYTLQASQLQVLNAGWAGEWAEDGALRLPGLLASNRPEAVLLMEGTNELGALGTPGIARASRAIDTMAREVRNRGARLFLATVPPTRTTGSNRIPPALIDSLNAAIRTTARGENAVLVDVFTALSADVTRYIGVDGLHPTEAGYQRIAETFFAAIRADLERVP